MAFPYVSWSPTADATVAVACIANQRRSFMAFLALDAAATCSDDHQNNYVLYLV
jgi:hypothetical protein